MTDRDVDLMNKLVATGGWLERALRKVTQCRWPLPAGGWGAIREAIDANREAIEILRKEKQDG